MQSMALEEAFGTLLVAPWFQTVAVIGIISFSISGVIIAHTEHYSVYGAFVLAALPAMGGGIMRDVILNRPLPVAIASPLYMLLVIGVVLGGFVLIRLGERLAGRSLLFFDLVHVYVRLTSRIKARVMLQVTDAVGLAAFTLTGVSVAFNFAPDPLLLWGPVFAAMSASGGGIIRDMMRPEAKNPLLKTSFYAEVALIWGFAVTALLLTLPPDSAPGTVRHLLIGAFFGVLGTRIVIIYYKWTSPRM